MTTLTGNTVFTVIVTPFEVAGLPLEQVSFEVRTQVTTSPLTSADEEYVAAVSPVIKVAPLYHW